MNPHFVEYMLSMPPSTAMLIVGSFAVATAGIFAEAALLKRIFARG